MRVVEGRQSLVSVMTRGSILVPCVVLKKHFHYYLVIRRDATVTSTSDTA